MNSLLLCVWIDSSGRVAFRNWVERILRLGDRISTAGSGCGGTTDPLRSAIKTPSILAEEEMRKSTCFLGPTVMFGSTGARRGITGVRGLATASKVRPNKRVARTSEATTLSSLISLYHLTPTFAPLSPALVKPHIVHAFLSKSRNVTPVPRDYKEMLRMKSSFDTDAASFDRSGNAINMLSAGTGEHGGSETAPPLPKSFDQSFLRAHTKGLEPAFLKRARLVVDVLHGTSAGGQAGLGSLAEHNQDTLEEIEMEKSRALDLAMEREALERQARARLDEEDGNFEGGFIDEEEVERR